MKHFKCLTLFLLLLVANSYSQVTPIKKLPGSDSLQVAPKNQKKGAIINSNKKQTAAITIKDYKIISLNNDTTYLDTTLTIFKEYKYNYLRKDNFELLPFSNLGQTYNSLSYNPGQSALPQIGALAKHFNYLEAEDIKYYHVPTPMTDLFFKTAMEQGQLVDAFLTVNTSPQFNFSVAYKGLRSLGKYQHILASTGNFRFTINYNAKNRKYFLRGHFASQDILNQENGGIVNKQQFESGDEEFTDRSRIDVAFQNAESFLLGKRYFFDQSYYLSNTPDSIHKTSLALHHRFNYETKLFRFEQSSPNDYFGDAFTSEPIYDQSRLKTLTNQLGVKFFNPILGNLYGAVKHYNYNYYFNSILVTPQQTITNKLSGDDFLLTANWSKKINNIQVKANADLTVSGNISGNYLNAQINIPFSKNTHFGAAISSSSVLPNFNYLLYQSDYQSYNWQNTNTFKTQKTNTLQASFAFKDWVSLKASYSIIDNFSYFGLNANESNPQVQPYQNSGTINYLKAKLTNKINFGKFSLQNTLMFQEVQQDQKILNVPQLITRNTLYYSNHVFKKAMYLQTGVTFKYFTSYYANAYNPLLGEFYVQDQEKIGNFPLIDFFINAKVRQTRIYLKAEHLNSAFTGYNFYSAPNYPYRDFIVRFGLVWNFFR